MQILIGTLFTPQGLILVAIGLVIFYGINKARSKAVKIECTTDDLVTMVETRDALNRKIDAATKNLGWLATRKLNKKLRKRGLLT